ncbi:MAG: PQQ-binding-like beta-propeller repeat protein [Actinobacteria bacterium]|nr:PQQ-binding-like beta-propeller repeat protein [Actinomycetota bacterium]
MLLTVVTVFAAVVGGWQLARLVAGVETTSTTVVGVAPVVTTAASTSTTHAVITTTSTSTTTTTVPFARFGDARTVGRHVGSVDGLTMFRGNPSRTFYGEGPVPDNPAVLWRYPDAAMCGRSSVHNETRLWCGTGWTGQPVVWSRDDGVTEIIIGAFDKAVHFIDADTGIDTRPPFPTGDLVKGSGSLDPDGYPLYYFGSRDNNLRILALDRDVPTELWALNANVVAGMWNNDWDSDPVIIDDILFEGGENSYFFAYRLNRSYGPDGLVDVNPEPLVQFPAFTDELVRKVGREQSIENSVAVYENRVYFANSAGRVVGLDLTRIDDGEAPVVFDYWDGDDTDATITVDRQGMLYVAIEMQRFNERSREVGQIIKLDPYTDGDPRQWGVAVPPIGNDEGGVWATPALGDGVLYVATHPGELLAIDTETGEVVWRDEVGWHAWSSPVIVDDTLVQAVNCGVGGALRAYDLTDPRSPVQVWETAPVGGCIESTPAIWKGRIYVGSRDGFFYAFGDG